MAKAGRSIVITGFKDLKEAFARGQLSPADCHMLADEILLSAVDEEVQEMYKAAIGINSPESDLVNPDNRCKGSGTVGSPTMLTQNFEGVCDHCYRTLNLNAFGFLVEHEKGRKPVEA